nr:inactive protein restricted TEV movement 1-like [Tanacetum cinerariifolium]
MKGVVWDQKGMSEIVQIHISHQNNCINSFQVSVASVDEDTGVVDVYAQESYGKPDGMNFNTVVIDHQKEYLVSVSGEYLNVDEDTGVVTVYAQKSYGNPDGMNFNTIRNITQIFY